MNYLKKFNNIASSENPVSNGEFVRLIGREVGRQHAFVGAAAPEGLASRAWCEDRRGGGDGVGAMHRRGLAMDLL